MSQVNANRSPGVEDLTREASGEGVAPRGSDRVAALSRDGQGRRS
ncbi:hypothetical protein ACMHYB_19615 [Sorangium sp. So ce1128]